MRSVSSHKAASTKSTRQLDNNTTRRCAWHGNRCDTVHAPAARAAQSLVHYQTFDSARLHSIGSFSKLQDPGHVHITFGSRMTQPFFIELCSYLMQRQRVSISGRNRVDRGVKGQPRPAAEVIPTWRRRLVHMTEKLPIMIPVDLRRVPESNFCCN